MGLGSMAGFTFKHRAVSHISVANRKVVPILSMGVVGGGLHGNLFWWAFFRGKCIFMEGIFPVGALSAHPSFATITFLDSI